MKYLQRKLQDCLLYFYFFLINYEHYDPLGTSGSFSLIKLIGIFYLLSIFLNPSILTSLNKVMLEFVWPKLLLIFWITIVSLLNFNELSTRFVDVAVILNLFIFIAIINHSLREEALLDKCFIFYVIGSITVSMLIFLNIGVSEDIGGRAQFFNSDLNQLAIKLTASFLIIISFFINDNLALGKYRFLLVAFLPFLFVAISRSGSRTALILIVLVILFLLFLWALNSKRKVVTFFITSISAASIVIGVIYAIEAFQESSVAIERLALTGSELDNSEGARFFLWAGFVSIILNYNNNLFFGNGLSGFDQLAYDFFGFVPSTHNVLLEVIIYTGIFGLILYLIFLYKSISAAINLYRFNNNLIGVILVPVAFTFIVALQGLSEKLCWLIFAYVVSKTIFYLKQNTSQR